MTKLYHYTKTSILIEHILPKMKLRLGYLSSMNDPREKEEGTFGGTNVPYSEIYNGYYCHDTHIDCKHMLAKNIKDRIQVICFCGATGEGWKNEMMWVHYADTHKGVCIEIDQEVLVQNICSCKLNHKLENMNYSEETRRHIHWDSTKDIEENITYYINNNYQDLAYKKSSYWKAEDEIRLMIINERKQIFLPVTNAITAIYLGIEFIDKYLPSIKTQIPESVKLYHTDYQNYQFEKWDI